MRQQSKVMSWSGWVIAGLLAVVLAFSASMKLAQPPEMMKQFVEQFGYTSDLATTIAIVELGCLILFLIPQTAVLGAVLLTGYLGGAVATHVRVHDAFFPPVIMGGLVWLSLFLRDARIRALLPIRSAA